MPFNFDESPGFLIDRNAHLLRQKLKEKSAELKLNLTTEEIAVLVALHNEDGQRIGDMAALLVRDTTTLTRQIEGLERKKCVKRETAPDDRRAVQVKLLKKGRTLFEKFDPVFLKLRDEVLSGISDKDRQTLLKCLHQIKSNLLSL